MRTNYNLEHSEIKDIVGRGGCSVPACAATAGTTLIIGFVPSFQYALFFYGIVLSNTYIFNLQH